MPRYGTRLVCPDCKQDLVIVGVKDDEGDIQPTLVCPTCKPDEFRKYLFERDTEPEERRYDYTPLNG